MVKNTTRVQKNIVGEITFNKKSGKEIKVLTGNCVICDAKKSTIGSDDGIETEGLASFFQILGWIFAKVGKN